MPTCGEIEISPPGSTDFADELSGTAAYEHHFVCILAAVVTLHHFFSRT
jgi:hypothetical protein